MGLRILSGYFPSVVRLATPDDAAEVARLMTPAALALYESLGFESWSDPPAGRNLLMRRRL
jgi:hypothetical protein